MPKEGTKFTEEVHFIATREREKERERETEFGLWLERASVP